MAKIEELALRVAEDALADTATAEHRMEALKILNAHYTMLLKSKAKSQDDGDEPNFNDFAETLNGIATKN
jgi:hypothetical protein